MKLLETIELRTASNNKDRAEKYLKNWIEQINQSQNNALISHAYSHINIDTDISVHLVYETQDEDENHILVGKLLASALKEYGLVNHNVWIER